MNYSDFQKHLTAGSLLPAYLFTGSEDYLAETGSDALVDIALPLDERQLNLTVLYGREPSGLAEALTTPPVFARMRVVVVKQAHELPDKMLDAVDRYLERPPEDGLLILRAADADRRKAFFRRKFANLTVVDCETPRTRELGEWIRRYLQGIGYRIAADAVDHLGNVPWPGLRDLVQELDRLALMVSMGGEITRRTIEEAGGGGFVIQRYRLTDAVGRGDMVAAIQAGDSLRLWGGFKATQLIGDLFRFFSQLWFVKRAQERAMIDEAKRLLGLKDFVFQKHLGLVRGIARDTIERAIIRLHDADLAIKSGERDEEVEIDRIIIELTGLMRAKAAGIA
ncbi:MAG: DNA polymerase III subunit delta [Calditrichaeota bacterium]|nr:DNA polymerase III subunit delta [Calditrichota bacterium]